MITAQPPATTTEMSASFSFTSSEPPSTFECSLDSAAFTSRPSPQGSTGLAAGAHTFRVRAIVAAGNVDPTPASTPWTIQGAVDCGPERTLNASADSRIDSGSISSNNKGSDSILKIMSKSGGNLRALVRFNLPTVPQGSSVEYATLRLFAKSASCGTRTLQAFALGGSWSNQPATTGAAVTTTSGTGYRQWAVASIVQAMYSSGSNNGFLIRDATEGQDAEQQFNSREKSDNPPQLVLTFKPAP